MSSAVAPAAGAPELAPASATSTSGSAHDLPVEGKTVKTLTLLSLKRTYDLFHGNHGQPIPADEDRWGGANLHGQRMGGGGVRTWESRSLGKRRACMSCVGVCAWGGFGCQGGCTHSWGVWRVMVATACRHGLYEEGYATHQCVYVCMGFGCVGGYMHTQHVVRRAVVVTRGMPREGRVMASGWFHASRQASSDLPGEFDMSGEECTLRPGPIPACPPASCPRTPARNTSFKADSLTASDSSYR